jgi:RNA polymerase sigma factor (sigma-70 family)
MPDKGDDEPSAETRPAVAIVTFDDAYRLHAELLREIAEKKFGVPPADAEALVNDVFTSYLIHWAVVRDPRRWLIGAVCHASRGYWRAESRTEPLPPDIHERPDPLVNDLEQRLVNAMTLGIALSRLGNKCRCTLRMYYAEGYSAAEIAEELGTTTGYVMQLLHTCRKRVREIYLALEKVRTP